MNQTVVILIFLRDIIVLCKIFKTKKIDKVILAIRQWDSYTWQTLSEN